MKDLQERSLQQQRKLLGGSEVRFLGAWGQVPDTEGQYDPIVRTENIVFRSSRAGLDTGSPEQRALFVHSESK